MAYNLPDKFKNIPAGELSKMLEDPEKSGLTFGDMLEIGSALMSVTPPSSESYKKECARLKQENEKLRKENERLKKLTKLLVGIEVTDED